MNPWDELEKAAPATRMSVKAGDTVTLFTVPESVKDAVDVSYYSSNSTKATYDNGVMHALAGGKVTVTAIVTAKYNNYVMEYSTALDITEDAEVKPTDNPPAATDEPIDKPTDELQVNPTNEPGILQTAVPSNVPSPVITPPDATVAPGELAIPAAPKAAKVKKSGGTNTNVTAKLTFKKSAGATEYIIYKKSKTVKKFTPAYKIKGKKLYKYNTNTKKYKKAGKVKYKKNKVVVNLKKLNMKKEKKIKLRVYAKSTKTGYKDAVSKASKTVTLK